MQATGSASQLAPDTGDPLQSDDIDELYNDAFNRLISLAHRRAYRILGVAADAEDVAAETLARASLRWHRLRHPADAWVTTVATNLAIDRQRRAWRDLPLSEELGGSVVNDVATRIDLARAIATLPRRQRQVIGLAFVAGFTEAEIAELLKCSASTVQTHKRRGLERLREALGGVEPDVPSRGPSSTITSPSRNAEAPRCPDRLHFENTAGLPAAIAEDQR